MLTWKKRAKKTEGPVAHYRHWFTCCGRYRVTESASKYEHGKDGRPLVRWYACEREEATGWWGIVSPHASRAAAMAACEARNQAAEKNTKVSNTPMPGAND